MTKIALLQFDNAMDGDINARHKTMLTMAESALKTGAELVFFPECFQYAGDSCDSPRVLAETYAEGWQKSCSALAKKYHAYVVPWDYHIAEDGKVYNTSYVLDRDGNFVGRYCKCNLTYKEHMSGISCGREIPVFDLDIGKVGIMICFDNYFPEVAAALGNKGAELILYPLYGDTLNPQWELKMRTRAIDHSLYVASCQIDSRRNVSFTGIVDPEGNVISRLTTDNSYTVTEIDLKRRVITNTSCSKAIVGEDLRKYLHKCRNARAFSSLSEEGYAADDWSEIFIK